MLNAPILCLMGPTASGKTALAAALVQRFPLEIISIDSAMIYRGFTIGAAKPDAELLAKAPHHLIDILDPIDSYSAAQCCQDVSRLCQEILQRRHVPLLVGGTMMYFNALQKGLSRLPQADEQVRLDLLREADVIGWEGMHQQLAKVDALSAARIHANDTQRIQRALEVYRLTGKSMSLLWTQPQEIPLPRCVNWVILPEDRAWLHARIAERFHQMLAAGFIDEVQQLMANWPLTAENPSIRSVGYRQVLGYLQGDYTHDDLVEKGIAATRQLAKRQLTWLRHWTDKRVFVAENPLIEREVLASVQQILDNAH